MLAAAAGTFRSVKVLIRDIGPGQWRPSFFQTTTTEAKGQTIGVRLLEQRMRPILIMICMILHYFIVDGPHSVPSTLAGLVSM